MSLGQKEVEKIANLVAIEVAPEQEQAVAEQLSNILDLFSQMQAVDTQAVAPMAHPLEQEQRLREDAATEGNIRDKLAAIAPAFEEGVYLVPQVIE